MTRPHRFLIRMIFFLLAVIAACSLIVVPLSKAFLANAALNGMILAVLVLGIIYIFRQVIMLRPEIRWLERLQRESQGGVIFPGALSEDRPPRLLAPMATMIGEKRGRLSLSTLSMRTLLDGIQSRIEEGHDISRYLIGLLIFLGLLGTFWGLLETVNAVGLTIAGLSGAATDPAAMFEDLKEGLATPLSGMGTAFSSSLFGLAGSLVLGFLELQAGQAHNRFMNELEEWIAGVTKLGSGGGLGEGDQSVPAYIQALLERTADSLDTLQRTMSRGEEERAQASRGLSQLSDRLGSLTDQMRSEQQLMLRVAESQNDMKPLFEKIADLDVSTLQLDEATRTHIRNLDLQLERLLNEVASGRDSTVQEIRGEIRLLARTIAAIAEETEQG
ncbi:MAG: flagellar motor protein MotA [Kiloniellales bacterium]|nr:flagellar motor protein MotA [Kiloniellales bacterium]